MSFHNGMSYNNYFPPITSLVYSLDKSQIVNVYIINYDPKESFDYCNNKILLSIINEYKKVRISLDSSNKNLLDIASGFIKKINPFYFNIIINHIDTNSFFNVFTNNITHLNLECNRIDCELNNLPNTIEKLKIYTIVDYDYNLDNLPINLKELFYHSKLTKPLNNLPPNLKLLDIQYIDNNNLLNNLPDSLQILSILDYYPFRFNNLPISLKELSFGQIKHTANGIKNYNPNYIIELKFKFPNLKIYGSTFRQFTLD